MDREGVALSEFQATEAAFDEEGFYMMGDALRPADPDDFSKGFFFDGRVAENFKLLENLYPGRIDLGIGRAPGSDGLTAAALAYGLKGKKSGENKREESAENKKFEKKCFPPVELGMTIPAHKILSRDAGCRPEEHRPADRGLSDGRLFR